MPLIIDYEKCIGCELCVIRCSLVKTGTINPAYSRIRIARAEEEGIMLPVVCRHCEEPLCLPSCPIENCITVDAATGWVRFDEVTCIGCRKCVRACPYGGPMRIPCQHKKLKNIKVICDLCGGQPACVTVCPTGTLQYGPLNLEQIQQKTKRETELAAFLKEKSPL
jgi:anaerobic carbon-monoxide dehydrogenase iron sulfur subunit